MRNRITDYTFEPGSRTITLTKFAEITIPDIRLIVNETQKVVLCSSMQKDLIASVSGNTITFVSTLPALADGDQLTIEVDTGKDVIYSGGADWYLEAKRHRALDDGISFEITREMGAQVSTIAEFSNIKSLFEGLYVTKADLSSWRIINNTSQSAQWLFRNCTMLEELDMSGLETVGPYGLQEFAQGCTYLRKVDLSSITSIGVSAFYASFQNANNLVTMIVHCRATQYNGAQNPITSATKLENLTLIGTPTDNIYLSWQPNLNYDSVKGILTLLASSTVSGKSCNFYSSTLHIEDHITEQHPNGELYDLATAATTAGWTINNLSIE